MQVLGYSLADGWRLGRLSPGRQEPNRKDWMIMSALARWCYQHRFVVITAWIGLLIGLTVMSQAVKTSYDNSFTPPGKSGHRGRSGQLVPIPTVG